MLNTRYTGRFCSARYNSSSAPAITLLDAVAKIWKRGVSNGG
jgi:hypothetical protein